MCYTCTDCFVFHLYQVNSLPHNSAIQAQIVMASILGGGGATYVYTSIRIMPINSHVYLCRLEREALERQMAEAEERTAREVENRVRREAEQEMRRQIEEKERAITEKMERFRQVP